MIGATYGRLVGILVVNSSNKDSVDVATYVWKHHSPISSSHSLYLARKSSFISVPHTRLLNLCFKLPTQNSGCRLLENLVALPHKSHLIVIMVEITNNLQLLLLIMLVLLISKAVGDAFNSGFYEEQVKLRSLPLRPQRFMRNLAAKDAITRRKVVQFSRVCNVGHIVAVL